MLITNFASGELSNLLNGRVDLPQYYSGASKISNFDIIPTGGLKRRKGFKRLGSAHGENRIIPFIVNSSTSFILEFCSVRLEVEKDGKSKEIDTGVIYIWKNGKKVPVPAGRKQEDLEGNTYTYKENEQLFVFAPYLSISEINEVQYAQDANRMIFVHRNYIPYELRYNADETFTYGLMSFDFYPDINLNLDDDYEYINIVETLPALSQADIKRPYYIADGTMYLFHKDKTPPPSPIEYEVIREEGIVYYLWYENTDSEMEIDTELFTKEGKRPGAVTFFNGRLWFASTKEKVQKVWASATPDTQKTRYNDFSTWQKYITVTKVIKEADIHVFSADVKNVGIYEKVSLTEKTFMPGIFYEKTGDIYNLSYYYSADRTYYSLTGSRSVFTLSNVTQDFTQEGVLKKEATQYYITNSEYIKPGTKVVSITADTITLDQEIVSSKDLKSITFTLSLWVNSENPSAADYEYQVISSNRTTSDVSFSFELASDQNDSIKWIGAGKYLAIGTESSIWGIPSGVTALNIVAEMNGRYGSDYIQGHCVGSAMIYFAQGNKQIREYYYDNVQEAFRTNDIALVASHLLRESKVKDFDFMTNPFNRIIITREDGKAISMLYDKNNGVMAWNRIEHGGLCSLVSCAVTRGNDETDLLYFTVKDKDGLYYLEILESEEDIFLDSFEKYDSDKNYDENYSLYNKTKDTLHNLSEEIPADFISEEDEVYAGFLYESIVESLPVLTNDPTGKKRIVNLIVRFFDSYFPEMKCEDTIEYFTGEEEPFSGQKKIDYAGNSDRDVKFTLKTEGMHPVTILSVSAQTA